MHGISAIFWNNIIYHYPSSGKEGHTFLTLHCDNNSVVWTTNHKQQQKCWNAWTFNQAHHTSSVTFTHSWKEMEMFNILKKVTYRLQHSDIQNWISALLQMPTFHLSLQVMWRFEEEEQNGKSDTLLSTAPHSIVGFGIRGAGFGFDYLKLLEQYTISKQSMTYQLCYEFPLSQETKDSWL